MHICMGKNTADQAIKHIFRYLGYLVYAHHDGHIQVEGDGAAGMGCDFFLAPGCAGKTVAVKASRSDDKKRKILKATGTRILSKETNRAATFSPPGVAQMSDSRHVFIREARCAKHPGQRGRRSP